MDIGEDCLDQELSADSHGAQSGTQPARQRPPTTQATRSKPTARKRSRRGCRPTWRGLFDCPYVQQDYIEEYRTLQGGWYHGLYVFMCRVAGNAGARGVELTPEELASLATQLDELDANWYVKRPLVREAQNAINFVN